MRNPNDPAGGKENDFLNAHDLLQRGLNSPEFAALNISPADKATITGDNADLHRDKTASDLATAAARQATKTKVSTFKRSEKNYRAIRQRIVNSAGYTPAIGLALGLEHAPSVAPGSTSSTGPQPVLRARPDVNGGAVIKSTKGKAEAVDIYCRRDSDADFVFLKRVMYFPYLDNRPLLVAGKPEKREYYGVFVRHDQPYGNASAIVTVIVSA